MNIKTGIKYELILLFDMMDKKEKTNPAKLYEKLKGKYSYLMLHRYYQRWLLAKDRLKMLKEEFKMSGIE